MKRILLASMLALCSLPAAADGIGIDIYERGFYGRIELGDAPRPRLIHAEPVLVERVAVMQAPVYLHVPPGHAKDWPKHCGKYGACGQRVLFVEEAWFNDVYVPHHKHKKAGHPGKKHEKGGPKDKGHKGKGHKDK